MPSYAHDGLESSPDHALHVERHRLHHILRIVHGRIREHLRVDLVAMCARFIDDEGEDHRLIRLGLHDLRKTRHLQVLVRDGIHHLRIQVVAHTLEIGQGAVLHPHLPPFFRHAQIRAKFLLRHRNYVTIDIFCHDRPLCVW